jgi:hypothetical protein
MSVADSPKFAKHVNEMFEKADMNLADKLTYEIIVMVDRHSEIYTGFRFGICNPNGFKIAGTNTLRGNPYSFRNRHAMKRVFKTAKRVG